VSKRPKMDEPTAISLLAPARAARERVSEFSPMVLYSPRHGQPMMAVLEGNGTLAEMLGVLLAEMRPKLGPATWIAVTTDNFAQPDVPPEKGGVIEHGQLAEAFAEGDPKVIEQMMVILMHRAKPLEIAAQTYRYLPSEGFEWDDAERIDGAEGPVLDVLRFYM